MIKKLINLAIIPVLVSLATATIQVYINKESIELSVESDVIDPGVILNNQSVSAYLPNHLLNQGEYFLWGQNHYFIERLRIKNNSNSIESDLKIKFDYFYSALIWKEGDEKIITIRNNIKEINIGDLYPDRTAYIYINRYGNSNYNGFSVYRKGSFIENDPNYYNNYPGVKKILKSNIMFFSVVFFAIVGFALTVSFLITFIIYLINLQNSTEN